MVVIAEPPFSYHEPVRDAVRRLGYTAWPMRCVAALMLAACSAGPAPVAHAADDPSNPNAAESTFVAYASADAGAVVYACPMHADVTSDHPGRCPRCGMALVPRR